MTQILPYLLITVKTVKHEKVSLCDRQNLKTVFFNALTAGHKYSLLNRDNLTQPIKMRLSLKGRTFSEFFSSFFIYK